MKNAYKIAISVKGVHKSFKLPHEKHSTVKGLFVNMFRRKRGYETQSVLKDISFEINKGDFFGIVGRNGSGKSTLLKLLAGIYTPDEGGIEVNGKLTPFIELGVGFNPELTGRENVFLNGALLGFNRNEMEAMYDEIVEFAELEKFMDQQLKNYSSGMQVRLAFSIAIRANTDILVLDEVLAVGDYNFQQKCFQYFRQLKRDKKTVILVSHDANAIQMFCNKAILIEKGKIVAEGKAAKVLQAYVEQNQSDQEKELNKKKHSKTPTDDKATGSVELLEAYASRGDGKTKVFGPEDEISVNFHLRFKEKLSNPVFGVIIQSSEGGQPIFATNTLDSNISTGNINSGEEKIVSFKIKNIFNDGLYSISGAVASSDRSILYVRYMNATEFSSVGWVKTAKAKVYLDYDFKLLEHKNKGRL